jgi:hypothetical protein
MMQALLVLTAAGLLMFAGYSWGRATGFDEGRRSGEIGGPARPSTTQVIVLGVLGLGALAGAFLLGGPGAVRIPTPARLDELTGRAQATVAERAHEPAPMPHQRAGSVGGRARTEVAEEAERPAPPLHRGS